MHGRLHCARTCCKFFGTYNRIRTACTGVSCITCSRRFARYTSRIVTCKHILFKMVSKTVLRDIIDIALLYLAAMIVLHRLFSRTTRFRNDEMKSILFIKIFQRKSHIRRLHVIWYSDLPVYLLYFNLIIYHSTIIITNYTTCTVLQLI